MEEVKTMKTPMSSSIKLDKDEKGKSIDSTIDQFGQDIGPMQAWSGFWDNWRLGFRLLLHFRTPKALDWGKCPAEPSQPTEMKAHQKVRFDTTFFSFVEDYQSISGLRSLQSDGLAASSDDSESIFPTLVHAFYSRVTYGFGGPIISTIRGVEIQLDLENICRILDIPPVGLKVYESKAWPTMLGFEPKEAIQMMCGLVDTQG
ncbi:hypothetical protein CK203_093265 [Vitis vinifera]|uniref:Uncharacterized protein n=1 Tax=Vitis vinifera TaxID=29760 RepID=A0A438CMG0_VITVI|nr:hypothetical protein CK203_093265 [Vitis vinifera]